MRLRGQIPRETKWDVVVDLYFYREPEEAEKEEQAAKELVAVKPEVVPHDTQELEWPEPQQWTDEPAPAPPAPAAPYTTATSDDWATQVQDDWAANATASQPAQPNWGSTTEWH